MQRLGSFFSAFRLYFDSFRFIRQHKLGRYMVLPILTALLLSLLFYLGIFLALDLLLDWFSGLISERFGMPGETLPLWLSLIINLLALFGAFFFITLLYSQVIALAVIPFTGPLLEKMEELLLGQSLKTTFRQDLANAVRSFALSLRYGLIAFMVLVISLLLTGPLLPVINFLVQSYLLGRGAFDYIFEKQAAALPQRSEVARQYRYSILGNGSAFLLFLFLPLVGMVIGPTFSLIAAARCYYLQKSD